MTGVLLWKPSRGAAFGSTVDGCTPEWASQTLNRRRLHVSAAQVDQNCHGDASRPGPVVQVGYDLDDGCRGGSGLATTSMAGRGRGVGPEAGKHVPASRHRRPHREWPARAEPDSVGLA